MKPTKPLVCVRFTLVNVKAYDPNEIVKAFRPELEKAGVTLYQTPARKVYTAKYSLSREGPFEGDDAKSVYETMTIEGPAGKPIALSMDVVNDPKGTRPILEQRKPVVSAFAWNLGPAPGMTPAQLGELIWSIRKTALHDKERWLGIGWSPVAESWENAPVKLPPYPDRPALPAVLAPPKPKPKPKPKPEPKPAPKPEPKPEPKPVIPPAPVPVVEKSRWPLYSALAGSALVWFYSNR